ncbi:MAG: hypothetical protein AB1814_04475 [Thermodesulfobacteriota bacterium]
MRRRQVLILCLILSLLAALPAAARTKGKVYRAGVFRLSLPASWSRMPPDMLQEWKSTMVRSGRELAEASQTADPKEISEKSIPFLSGFQRASKGQRILLVLSGMTSGQRLNRDEMLKTNQERVQWGIKTGRLKPSSRGVSKLTIDGVPCLLQDVETKLGGRMKMYSFFLPQRPKMAYGLVLVSEDKAAFDRHAKEIQAIVKSIKVARQKRR